MVSSGLSSRFHTLRSSFLPSLESSIISYVVAGSGPSFSHIFYVMFEVTSTYQLLYFVPQGFTFFGHVSTVAVVMAILANVSVGQVLKFPRRRDEFRL